MCMESRVFANSSTTCRESVAARRRKVRPPTPTGKFLWPFAAIVSVILLGNPGCASAPRAAIIYDNPDPQHHDYAENGAPTAPALAYRTPNLLLGGSAETLEIAQDFAYRSDWPSTPFGYFFDDLSSFTEVVYDDQAFYDRLGGSFYHHGEQIRTGALLRK